MENDHIPVGYNAIVGRYNLKVQPHYRKSIIGHTSKFNNFIEDSIEVNIFPKSYLPKDSQNIFSQLKFAFKYDGLNIEILKALFSKLTKSEITKFIKSKPTGQLSRKLWYLYEKLTDTRLNIPDAKRGSYALLLDPKQYYTGCSIRCKRHYVIDNLLGNFSFCPFVRKTKTLLQFEKKKFDCLAKKILSMYDDTVIERAMRYLYMKETMSSYEIEREQPGMKRLSRFVSILHDAEKTKKLTKQNLIELQNKIVDPRFVENDYRNFQNYVGEEPALGKMIVHFIPPKSEDVNSLMDNWFICLERMLSTNINPVVIAAAISFSFVFIHPFGDGNGRLHRFLIHYILSKTSFVPMGSIFPVSSIMLKEIQKYDHVLESISSPIIDLIKDYKLSKNGEMTVEDDTISYYQYIDYTKLAEFLFECVGKTIQEDFKKEIDYLVCYDKAKQMTQQIVDMPDRKIDQIFRFIYQNNGKLAPKKRLKYFSMLTDKEILEIEKIISLTILLKI